MFKSLAKWEKVFCIAVLILALVSRFLFLGDRAMSHDESIHTKFSWNLFSGAGFQHNPMMHGPLLFEVTALNYELFGVNDFTSRIFVALVGVALVLSPLLFRRWIGPAGAAAASLMLLISPSITYYSRYIRHDIPLLMSALVLLWALLRWVDDGEEKFLYYAAAAFSIVYSTKEASYMYTLIFLLLCVVPVLIQLVKMRWQKPELIKYVIAITAVIVICGLMFAFGFLSGTMSETALNDEGSASASTLLVPVWARVAGGLAFILIFADLVMIVRAAGEETVRANRWFDVVISIGTLTLPLGSAFLIQFIAGVDMDVVYSAILNGNFASVPPNVIAAFVIVILAVFALSIALGLWWNKRVWLRMALIHYSLFFVIYTTIFTWIFGALTGLVGSLAYWLGQQDDKRGGQPYFYYLMIGGLYEYLPILVAGASTVLVFLGLKRKDTTEGDDKPAPVLTVQTYLPWFLLGWTLLSWIIYTWAGEKMPWLVVHIAFPSIFLASLAFQRLYERLVDAKHSLALWSAADLVLVLGAGVVLTIGSVGRFMSLVGTNNPEAGYSLAQLNAAGAIVGGALLFLFAAWLLARYTQKHGFAALGKMVSVAVLLTLITLTVRTNVMANYLNDELATEFLVYAHGAPDIKVALDQIQDISWITNGAPNDIKVAYGEDGSWPLTWYMVDYPNNYFYGSSPAPEVLLDCPAIIAGAKQFDAVDAIVGTEYRYFTYNFIWWPIQDYFGLTFERASSALTNPDMRKALWDIVWARDYSTYASLKNPLAPFDLASWPLRGEFRLYVRDDLAQQAWGHDYGAQTITSIKPQATVMPDPYNAGGLFLPIESVVTLPGAGLRGFALAEDGTVYVGDTTNHIVWHVDMDGNVLDSIGNGMGSQSGQFMEPWDVALDDVGNVYVADTWNHRVQKYSPTGEYVTEWGINGMASDAIPGQSPVYFFGPRGITYHNGEIFVTDTGNKRVQVFDTSGTLLRAFGGAGLAAGTYDEPVGIAIDDMGTVAVVDTWHRRMQLVDVDGRPSLLWDVPVWDSANPDVKPYVAFNGDLIAVTDPAHRRVLIFNYDGEFQWALSAEAGTSLTFAQAVALTEDAIYVTDTYAGTLTKFLLP